MGPYQVLCILAGCVLSFAAVVAFLSAQGVPVIIAFLSVYALAIAIMVGMLRRARQLYDSSDS